MKGTYRTSRAPDEEPLVLSLPAGASQESEDRTSVPSAVGKVPHKKCLFMEQSQ